MKHRFFFFQFVSCNIAVSHSKVRQVQKQYIMWPTCKVFAKKESQAPCRGANDSWYSDFLTFDYHKRSQRLPPGACMTSLQLGIEFSVSWRLVQQRKPFLMTHGNHWSEQAGERAASGYLTSPWSGVRGVLRCVNHLVEDFDEVMVCMRERGDMRESALGTLRAWGEHASDVQQAHCERIRYLDPKWRANWCDDRRRCRSADCHRGR